MRPTELPIQFSPSKIGTRKDKKQVTEKPRANTDPLRIATFLRGQRIIEPLEIELESVRSEPERSQIVCENLRPIARDDHGDMNASSHCLRHAPLPWTHHDDAHDAGSVLYPRESPWFTKCPTAVPICLGLNDLFHLRCSQGTARKFFSK